MKTGSLITTNLPAKIWDVNCNAQKSIVVGTTSTNDIYMVIKENEYEVLVLCRNSIIGWITKLHAVECKIPWVDDIIEL